MTSYQTTFQLEEGPSGCSATFLKVLSHFFSRFFSNLIHGDCHSYAFVNVFMFLFLQGAGDEYLESQTMFVHRCRVDILGPDLTGKQPSISPRLSFTFFLPSLPFSSPFSSHLSPFSPLSLPIRLLPSLFTFLSLLLRHPFTFRRFISQILLIGIKCMTDDECLPGKACMADIKRCNHTDADVIQVSLSF